MEHSWDKLREKHFDNPAFDTRDVLENRLEANLRALAKNRAHVRSIVRWPWTQIHFGNSNALRLLGESCDRLVRVAPTNGKRVTARMVLTIDSPDVHDVALMNMASYFTALDVAYSPLFFINFSPFQHAS